MSNTMQDVIINNRLLEEQAEQINGIKQMQKIADKKKQLASVEQELLEPDVWNDQEKVKSLNQAKSKLERAVASIEIIEDFWKECQDLFELFQMENDDELFSELEQKNRKLQKQIDAAEFLSMLNEPSDHCHCYLSVQAGSGGTEAQDWAEMLLRMYLRWCENRGFTASIEDYSPGEVAGVKGCTVLIEGDYSYGWLRTEMGVHRLVRRSPFDSGNRRHTSFASIFVSPQIDTDIEIDIDMKEVRVDTYRASGAGGQHVNKTDSAVRLTHIPSGIVVQCQNQRSQHQNKDSALKQLRSKLYELEIQKQKEQQLERESEKKDIGWGNQIRSYVLDQSRIKDLRTQHETSNPKAVLDGDLDPFIQSSLRAGV